MKNRTIRIPIQNCALCGKDHIHVLLLEEEPVLSLMIATSAAQRTQDFEVYLTCPNKNGTFKAVVSLVPTVGTTIKKVSEER